MTGNNPITVAIGNGGIVDANDFLASLKTCFPLRKIAHELETNYALREMEILDLISHLVEPYYLSPLRNSMFLQLVWRISDTLDVFCETLWLHPEATRPFLTVKNPEHVDHQAQTCATYYYGFINLVSMVGTQFLSGSTDESAVHCFNLMNGAYAVPSGEAFWAVPQVLFCYC